MPPEYSVAPLKIPTCTWYHPPFLPPYSKQPCPLSDNVKEILIGIASSEGYVLALSSDTETIYSATTQKILDRYGKTFDWSVKSRMMGHKPIEAAGILVEALGIPLTAHEFNTELYSVVEKLFPEAKLMPGK